MTGLETILLSGASFVFGAVAGVVGFGRQFVTRNECKANRDGCGNVQAFTQRDLHHMSAQISEMGRWIRMIAKQVQVELPERRTGVE
jgi:hypothetical protein